MVGVAKYEAQDIQGAKQEFNKVLKVKPENTEQLYFHGIAHYGTGRYATGMKELEQAAKHNLEFSQAYDEFKLSHELSSLLRIGAYESELAMEGFAKVIEDYSQAVNSNPQNGETYYFRGMTKFKTKDYSGAINDLSQALDLNCRKASAYYYRGLAKQALYDKPGAIEDLKIADKLGHKKAYRKMKILQSQ
jgi:tetratricopeptide (TPR) repeat protein